MNNIIITLSGKMHAGKDLCAELMTNYLVNKDVRVFRLAYADYLKVLAKRNFGYNDDDKEAGRTILQAFGTDIVREIEPDFWVGTVFNTIDMLKNVYDVFIITDARFDNELQPYPWRIGYPIFNVYVDRKAIHDVADTHKKHASEAMANKPDLNKFHFVIENNGTIDSLNDVCTDVVNYIFTKRDEYIETLKEKE